MADGDIFVLPSRSEPFPNCVLEAMAAGLPVVATRVGGIVELIDDGVTGLLVTPGNAPALTDRLSRLMDDPAFASRLGPRGPDDVLTRYSFDRMVGAFEALYLTELTRCGADGNPPSGRPPDMCGIAGTIQLRPLARPVDPAALDAMTSRSSRTVVPTPTASTSARGVGLGHRRLSIIDLVVRRPAAGNEDGTSGSCSTARSTTSPSCAPSL